ncbi:MAG: hypothetical protein GX621_04865 [Pirellulaceae bacterium]|nr:hypothetical protein [Pirellulaceae bacterium]
MTSPPHNKSFPPRRLLWSVGVCLAFCGVAAAGESSWRPELVDTTEIHGRTVLRYEHDCPAEWGYAEPRRDYFYVVLPKNPHDAPPLLVMLHSAGGSGEKELAANVERVVAAGPEFAGLAPNAAPSGQADWWWGAHAIKKHPKKYRTALTPAENRVLATIDWTARNQRADRNRIYLHGISMGGSGTLGLGLCRGDRFAAICAKVPAGAEHATWRMELPRPPSKDASPEEKQKYLRQASRAGLPDAPPLLTFSSQLDKWSKGQEAFLRGLHDGRHAVVFAWGPWGHANVYHRYHPAAYEFPWLSIRRDEAFPVFTNASSDDHYPGHLSIEPDQAGQVNALFRWKTLEDTPARFAIELRLVRPDELNCPVEMPEHSTVDVTPRRLQQFRVDANGEYAWELRRQGKVVASGTLRADAAGLLTVPRVTITRVPAVLVVREPVVESVDSDAISPSRIRPRRRTWQ